MAAPKDKNITDMSGKWVVDTKMSSGFDEFLGLQGLAWWKRQAVNFITLTEEANQYIDEDNITHIDIVQRLTGGFKGGNENRIIDGVKRPLLTEIFGEIQEWSQWTDLSDIGDDFLCSGWSYSETDGTVKGGPNGERHIEVCASIDKGRCMTKAIWGFIELDGKRYHARKAICTRDGVTAKCTGIYKWRGSA